MPAVAKVVRQTNGIQIVKNESCVEPWASFKNFYSVCAKDEIKIDILDHLGVIPEENYSTIVFTAKKLFIVNVSRNEFLPLIDNREAACCSKSTRQDFRISSCRVPHRIVEWNVNEPFQSIPSNSAISA